MLPLFRAPALAPARSVGKPRTATLQKPAVATGTEADPRQSYRRFAVGTGSQIITDQSPDISTVRLERESLLGDGACADTMICTPPMGLARLEQLRITERQPHAD